MPFVASLFELLDHFETSSDVRIILAIQDKKSIDNLLQSFRNRGNSEEFVERRMIDFQKCHDIIASSKFEKVYINDNEFLTGALLRFGFKLEKGQGVKNYI